MGHNLLAQRITKKLAKGCGDNSCLVKKPVGMATNGGCRCFKWLDYLLREVNYEDDDKKLIEKFKL
jgi:hypothetical protein